MAGSSTADLRLRPTRDGDVDYVVAAEADPDNAPYLAPSPGEEHREWMHDAVHRHLVAEAGGERVGFALLREHPDDRAVELRRLAITIKRRGYGRATLRAVMAMAFEELVAHRLWLDVKPHNERARALYRSEGFVEEGTLRDALYYGGRFESLVVMSILEPEWTAR
jgi:diamine N-acetyltransferase